jgi:homoserine kinase
VRVVVPATSANLGPGFDALAVALDLCDELAVEPARRFTVEIDGPYGRHLPRDDRHRAVRAFCWAAGLDSPPPLRFRQRCRAPQHGGLGGSASAGVAGALLGLTWRHPETVRPGRIAALADPISEGLALGSLGVASRLDGHPDNAAACVQGGFVWTGDGTVRRLADAGAFAGVVVIPSGGRVSTERAREALPAEVPHGDAARTAGRAALLGNALAAGDAGALADALEDRIHEPYRAPLNPLFGAVRAAAPALGALGATLSGSGPAILLWTRIGEQEAVAAAAREWRPDLDVVRPVKLGAPGAVLHAN